MACSCQKSNVQYEVTFKDRTTQTFASMTLAQAAIRQAGGGMMRAKKA